MNEKITASQVMALVEDTGFENYTRFIMPDYSTFATKIIDDTAEEFFKAGVLKPPFDNTLYTTRFEEKGNPPLKIWLYVTRVKAQSVGETDTKDALAVHLYLAQQGKEYNVSRFPSGIVMFHDFTFKGFSVDGYKKSATEEEYGLMRVMCRVALACMLLPNLKEYEKEQQIYSDRQQKKRASSGKSPLQNTVIVRMKGHYQDYCDGIKLEGKKPHWRRGHLRHLASGKITSVMPCMVNWDGSDISPNQYKILD